MNTWKNAKNAFKEMRDLNIKELQNSKLPNHMDSFIKGVNQLETPIKSLLDIGCGAGIFYKVCLENFPLVKYTGIDYSSNAIQIAKSTFPKGTFKVQDFQNLTSEDAEEFDIIYLGALLDVLPNALNALTSILKHKFKIIVLGRVRLTTSDDYVKRYTAYDEIDTCMYFHNEEKLKALFTENKYSIKYFERFDTGATIIITC